MQTDCFLQLFSTLATNNMRRYDLCFILLPGARIAQATHLRGGYISARQLSELTYEISAGLWTDTGSPVRPASASLFINRLTICLSDLELSFESSDIEYSSCYEMTVVEIENSDYLGMDQIHLDKHHRVCQYGPGEYIVSL